MESSHLGYKFSYTTTQQVTTEANNATEINSICWLNVRSTMSKYDIIGK